MNPVVGYICGGLLAIFIVGQLLVRIIRRRHKAPTPPSLVGLIDHPLRRRFQPPDSTAVRHGIRDGMRVLEVGPGSGTYTIAAARQAGEQGQVIAIDIEPQIVDRLRKRVEEEGIENLEARVADVFDLPFPDAHFDLVYMMTVIGEIPTPERAVREFHRVLKPAGKLVFSEFLPDPDYMLPRTLVRMAESVGFREAGRIGNLFYYTLRLEKPGPEPS